MRSAISTRLTSLHRLSRPLSAAAGPPAGPAAAKEPPTPLTAQLARRVRFGGPLSVALFMRECLTHPRHGYYAGGRDPLGAAGDFTTSPEVSQVFGELVGVWACALGGAGPPRRLVELGPGRGTLMADVLRTARRIGGGVRSVALVETGERLRALQRRALKDEQAEVRWYGSLDEVPPAKGEPTVFLMHEFLDALPVHVFEWAGEHGWRERLVDLDDGAESEHHFRFVRAPGPTIASVLFGKEENGAKRKVGETVEYSAEAMTVVQKVAERVAEGGVGSAALIVDYGWDGAPRGTTLRGVWKHRVVSPLSRVGDIDLTTDVDFRRLRDVVNGNAQGQDGVKGVRWVSSVTQRDFLLRMGVAARFRMLGRTLVGNNTHLTDEELTCKLKNLQQDYDRLTSESEMGTVYRVSAIVHNSIKAVPGFS